VDEGKVHLLVSQVKAALRRSGLLPFTDKAAPSLVTIVAGAPVSGSWWGHPSGRSIYEVSEALEADPDVLVVKLWRGKLTLVHRRLWPALARVGRSRSAWQLAGLGADASMLLAEIEREGRVGNESVLPDFPLGLQGLRPALRVLEQRLLVLTRSVHTSSGAHALEAESWGEWNATTGTPNFRGSVASAQLSIEEASRRLAPRIDPIGTLPWGRSRAMGGSRNGPRGLESYRTG
jgi:hypothetical protein